MNIKEKSFPHLLAILLMIVWGMSYLSIKIVVAEMDPILSAFYRFLIAFIILYAVLKIKFPEEKLLKEDKFKVALSGFLGVGLYFIFENYSVLYTTTSNVAILISSIPVFTLIAQRIVFKEKLTTSKILGATLSFIGIIIIITAKERVSFFSKGTFGDMLALSCALIWVLYNIVTSKFKGTYKSITISTYQILWGCIFLSPSIFFNPISLPSNKTLFNLLYLSIFCSCIAYAIYVFCLEKLGATIITTYINLQPIVSLISARFILKENITSLQIAGCIIIILGVFFVSYGDIFFNYKKLEINN